MSDMDSPAADSFSTDKEEAIHAISSEPISSDHFSSVTLAQAYLAPDMPALSRKIGRGCHTSVPALSADAVLALYLADENSVHWIDLVVFSGAFGSIEVEQGSRLIRTVCGIDLGEVSSSTGDDMLDWLYAAVLGRLQGTPFACADRLSRSMLTDTSEAVTLRMVLRTGQHVITFHARATASCWHAFLSQTTWEYVRLPADEYSDVPFDFPVRIGRHTLPADVLSMLSAGDILLPETPYFLCSGEGCIRIGALNIRVHYQAPSILEVTAVEGSMENVNWEDEQDDQDDYDDDHDGHDEMDDEDEDAQVPQKAARSQEGRTALFHPGQAGDADVLDKVPVKLDFELGHLRVSLGELRSWGPGVVLPLTGGSPASIAIVSSGRVLGHGEVVDVNGQLGIRIVQWRQSR